MKTLLVLCCMFVASPAWAVPLTWDFAGGQSYMSVTGSFTYESTAAPNAYNVHHLATNATYALTSWDITVNNTFASIPSPYLVNFPPSMTFSNLLADNTSEFCIGKCIFSSQPYESLRFYSGEYFLQLEFKMPGSGPFILTPPDTLEEWGALDVPTVGGGGASSFESSRVISLLTSGGITGVSSPSARVADPAPQSVPEPSTLILDLMAAGLWGLLTLLKFRVI